MGLVDSHSVLHFKKLSLQTHEQMESANLALANRRTREQYQSLALHLFHIPPKYSRIKGATTFVVLGLGTVGCKVRS